MIHNNSSMNTIAETFFISETVNLIHDNDSLERWNTKVKELNLKGQEKVLIYKDKSPIPFLWMNSCLVQTFKTLCPTSVDIDKYDKTPIPVDLLDVVALCVNEKYFTKIRVWYNEKEKDPVIVGYVEKEDSNYKGLDWHIESYSEKYLIGRWADVKASLDSLIERAKSIFLTTETIRLKKEIKDKQRELEDIEFTTLSKFGAGLPKTDLPF